MTEAELLDLFTQTRVHLDQTIAQLIALNFALVIAIYYFLYRAGLFLKIAIFILYAIGCFVFVSSAGIAGQEMLEIANELLTLRKARQAGEVTNQILDALSGPTSAAYILAANAANFLLLIGAFAFLFFWKPSGNERR